MRKIIRCSAIIISVLLLAIIGCESDDDYDHRPPGGQGSLIIDNNTYDDIYVFIDGHEVLRTPYRSERAYDLQPGLHRVVLDQRGGDRYYADDVDILEGRVTIWDVVLGDFDYYVYKWID